MGRKRERRKGKGRIVRKKEVVRKEMLKSTSCNESVACWTASFLFPSLDEKRRREFERESVKKRERNFFKLYGEETSLLFEKEACEGENNWRKEEKNVFVRKELKGKDQVWERVAPGKQKKVSEEEVERMEMVKKRGKRVVGGGDQRQKKEQKRGKILKFSRSEKRRREKDRE